MFTKVEWTITVDQRRYDKCKKKLKTTFHEITITTVIFKKEETQKTTTVY